MITIPINGAETSIQHIVGLARWFVGERRAPGRRQTFDKRRWFCGFSSCRSFTNGNESGGLQGRDLATKEDLKGRRPLVISLWLGLVKN